MKDKKYLDKVIGHLVKGTKIDYENKEVKTPFNHRPRHLNAPFLASSPLSLSFYSYCKNTFGLTEEEMVYVWKEYVDIINGKIENEG